MASLFKTPKVPNAPKPIPMPDMDELKKQKRRQAARMSQSGRAATILTDESLGG